MPERGGEPDFTVHIPSWRLDVEREIDLIEEIARCTATTSLPTRCRRMQARWSNRPTRKETASFGLRCWRLGYNEAVSLSFISHEDAETFSSAP